jgi:hypothetical protein
MSSLSGLMRAQDLLCSSSDAPTLTLRKSKPATKFRTTYPPSRYVTAFEHTNTTSIPCHRHRSHRDLLEGHGHGYTLPGIVLERAEKATREGHLADVQARATTTVNYRLSTLMREQRQWTIQEAVEGMLPDLMESFLTSLVESSSPP